MSNFYKTIAFVFAVTFLSLAVFPAFAQVARITGPCGFFPCTGFETFANILLFIQNRVLFWVMPIVTTLTVVYLIVAAAMYIMSTGEPEKADRAKRQIIYALLGLILASTATIITLSVYSGIPGPLQTAIGAYIDLALFLFGTLATIYLIYAGFKYITSQGDEEASATAKRQILYALIGLFVAGTAGIIVTAVTTVDATTLLVEVRSVANAVLTLLSVAAVLYIILGGVMYISSQGDEDKAERAKMQIIYALLGIVVIILSAVLVNFIIGAI